MHFISYLESLEENDYLIFMNKAVESASKTPDASCNVAETLIFLASDDVNFARRIAYVLGMIGRLGKAEVLI